MKHSSVELQSHLLAYGVLPSGVLCFVTVRVYPCELSSPISNLAGDSGDGVDAAVQCRVCDWTNSLGRSMGSTEGLQGCKYPVHTIYIYI